MRVQNVSLDMSVWPAAAPRMALASLSADLATISVGFDQTTNQVLLCPL